MFCFDADSCNERYQSHPYWMSSKDWKPQFAQGGIFSNNPSESSFYNANLVYVKRVPPRPPLHFRPARP